MQVEDLTHDLPLALEFDEIEEIRKTMPGPVIWVDSGIGTGTNHVYTAYFGLDVFGRSIGASGSRVLSTLIYALKRTGGKRGIAALCLGGANGIAMAIEI